MKEYPEDIVIENGDFISNEPFYPPRIPCDTDKNYIKHVHLDGARFHVIFYSTLGRHCSEKNCIINKPIEEQR